MRRTVMIILILSVVSTVAGQTMEEANGSLQEADTVINEMKNSNIPIQRVSDLYEQANNTYLTQVERNRSGQETDYTVVLETVEQIKQVRTQAFRAKDELNILRSRIEELDKNEDINLSEAKNKLEDAEVEFQDERFERAQEQIDLAYQEISDAQSAVTQAQAFASATSNNLRSFLENNWKRLSAAILIATVFSYLVYKEYQIYSLKKEKKNLKRKREVLQELVAEAQNKFFQKNDLAETAYNTRTDKYGEMIRDINRQIPLVNEDLEKQWSLSQVIGEKISENSSEAQEA